MQGMDTQRMAHRMLLSSSLRQFTTKMFKAINMTDYILGTHHKMIMDALDAVVHGECNRLIINIAPRYGKCVSPDSKIFTSKGVVQAADIKEGDMLYTFDEGKCVLERCNGVGKAHKPSVRIKMRSGRTFECSFDHPMLTATRGYVWAERLRLHDDSIIACDYNTKEFIYNDTVESVEAIGIMDLIDIEVNRTHNFIANGMVSHNTALASQMFIAYGLALNPKSTFLHLSYSSTLAEENSASVKEIVNSEYYQAVFDTRVKYGSNAKSKWATEQGGGVYATSTLGQVTGFGAGKVDVEPNADGVVIQEFMDEFEAAFNPDKFSGAIVIDDPIKPEDALSDNLREKVNTRFETTIRNRANSRRTPIIVIMQRLHEHDLCGYLQEAEPDTWRVLELPAIQVDADGNETALWPFKHTLEELHALRDVNPFVFETQYMQNPKPLEGLMYRPFKTYEIIPFDKRNKNVNYTDPADTGADWLCSINYVETPWANYVTDILFTKKSMDYTQQALANMLCKGNIELCHIEANGAGRVFGSLVEKLCREMGNVSVKFHLFPQTKNKMVRIFSQSNEVNNMVIFPSDWERRWPDFARHVKGYRKEGINAHDDGVDAMTGTLEMRGRGHVDPKQVLKNLL